MDAGDDGKMALVTTQIYTCPHTDGQLIVSVRVSSAHSSLSNDCFVAGLLAWIVYNGWPQHSIPRLWRTRKGHQWNKGHFWIIRTFCYFLCLPLKWGHLTTLYQVPKVAGFHTGIKRVYLAKFSPAGPIPRLATEDLPSTECTLLASCDRDSTPSSICLPARRCDHVRVQGRRNMMQ